MDYNLPDDIALSCEEILNRSPETIADLETMLGNIINEIDDGVSVLTIEHKEEKQSILKALINSDDRIKKLKDSRVKCESMLNRWKAAQTNARAFYKAKTNQ